MIPAIFCGALARTLMLLLFTAGLLSAPVYADPEQDVGAVLDGFHSAAAGGDFEAYFGSMTDDAVFLGTDGSERWQGQDFRDFSRPHFEAGGWRYDPVERHIDVDAARGVAWFDELLSHDRLGQCRGSGILLLGDDGWKIAQYNLSVPIPNELVDEVAARIGGGSELPAGAPATAEAAAEVEAVEEAEEEKDCSRARFKTNRRAGC